MSELNAIYNEIGQFLVDRIPIEFKDAWISVEMLDDVWGSEIFYRKANGEIGYINEEIEFLDEKFKKLREIFRDISGSPWSTATFKLDEKNKINIEFGYEDVSDLGLAQKRRKIWIKKYLGESPIIDWGG